MRFLFVGLFMGFFWGCSNDESGFNGRSPATASPKEDQNVEAKNSPQPAQQTPPPAPPSDPLVVAEEKAEEIAPLPAPATLIDVVKTCEGPQETMTERLAYPPTNECSFGQGDNLTALDGVLRAKEEQRVPVTLPEGAVICSIALVSETQSLLYDDALALVAGGYQLMSSVDNTSQLSEDGGLFLWDWTKVLDQPFGANNSYCAGTCTIPGHDVAGRLQMSFTSEQLAPLSLSLVNEKTVDFTVVTMGDNDAGDCEHTDLNMDLTIQYVVP